MAYANTLLGYFKNAVSKRCESVKYLDRNFLATFLHEYKQSHEKGYADYTETKKTKFYAMNGSAYCVFLEEYEQYRQAMDRLHAMGF